MTLFFQRPRLQAVSRPTKQTAFKTLNVVLILDASFIFNGSALMHVAQAQLLLSAFENTVVVFSPHVNQERGLWSTELNKNRDKQETIAPITHL